jgi:hypothetical protein
MGEMAPAEPLIELTREKTIFRGSAADLDRLKETFERQHWLRLPQLVSPDLLRIVHDRLDHHAFALYEHQGIGKELVSSPGTALSLLMFLANDQRLFDLIGRITGHDNDIQCFTGRVYRMDPGSDHYDSWHDDLTGHRLIAMSLNLATESHQGGRLQIRDRSSKRILQEVSNTTHGDAIIFQLARELQHRVTSVDGAAPRVAFAGWFRSQPTFMDLVSGAAPDAASDH